MTKITIFSGFLGAGKTTLIKKLIQEGYKGEKLVLIENEFGQIGIDGGFLQDAGVEITEMNSGCICCSLVGDFGKALEKVLADYAPDRILIEPSGVGKLSDVIRAVQNINAHDVELDGFTTVVDAKKYKMYMKNFGEFFDNQITYASCLILSHTSGLSQEKLDECVKSLREKNPAAPIVTTEWDQLTGAQLVDAMTQKNTLDDELKELLEEAAKHDHHHHHDDDDDEHEHHHHHHDDDDDEHHHHHDDDDDEHEHHHHHHDDDDDEHKHHHHDHGPDCTCGCHDHDHDHDHEHHHHHHADDVFTSWGRETTRTYTVEEITAALNALGDEEKYGMILRAKGIVAGADGKWIHYDYVPGVPDVRNGSAGTIGRLCVIGSKINEEAIAELFNA
ncbi:CobW family GTP-binding protein [Ruminococcus flavefaciens]|uniref:CobW/HypB/UreG family nucleotide-binding protein n=1 Tax=Ruminococcus flavefaciens TaxID=1265 RepID=A0A315Y619_RUMFL|nr:CobW family GTP-binding protein [Ruminococcus flavefaciens]PWJ15413.1 CobW/HypB/UreG family nucleotide-binding protein [Ruminococcus flavefaciens]SSA40559.1 CobW/HypB/UreG, nucleotide-binding domain [Ruminococcus flavefaciens]